MSVRLGPPTVRARLSALGRARRSAAAHTSLIVLLSLTSAMQCRAQATESLDVLNATVRLVETKEESERAFKTDVTAKGLVAVLVTLSNPREDGTATFRRSDVLLRTEFDQQLSALEAQRAYDKLMMKVDGGPYFAEYGLGRAMTEGSKKKTLRETVLQRALPETVVLGPGQHLEAAIFFERGKHTGSFAYSMFVIREVLAQADGRRVSFSMPLRPQD